MFTLPDLPYAYDAYAPFDQVTMEIHHTRHHQTYIDNANKALADTDWIDKSPRDILQNLEELPEAIYNAVKNNVGGHCNHSFFWTLLKPGGAAMGSSLTEAIETAFGSIETFKDLFKAAALGQFGSGWAWLVLSPEGELEVISTANQDSPLSLGYTRVLGLDVWEHAYYLGFQNKRPDYVDAFWQLLDGEQATAYFDQGGI